MSTPPVEVVSDDPAWSDDPIRPCASRSGFKPARWYRPPGNSLIEPLFLKLASILVNGRRSDLLRRNPRAISSVEAGSLLTCRKRNMLSGLKCEGRGIGRARLDMRLRRTADSTQFFFIRA